MKQASSRATLHKLSPWEATSCGQGLQAQSAANYQISALTGVQKASVFIENEDVFVDKVEKFMKIINIAFKIFQK